LEEERKKEGGGKEQRNYKRARKRERTKLFQIGNSSIKKNWFPRKSCPEMNKINTIEDNRRRIEEALV